jgi:hypothetical protein
MTQSNDWNELFNKSLLNNLFAVYKRRPLRPPFLLVLSELHQPSIGIELASRITSTIETDDVHYFKLFNIHFNM